jgi:probable O-glycosylation ligase (exosortase A-associated)
VYIAATGLAILLGVAAHFVEPHFLIIGLLAPFVVVLIIQYEYAGLILYLIIFMTRPGEVYPSLAPLRLEFLLGGFLAFLTLMKNKYKYGAFTIPRSNLINFFVAFLVAMAISFPLSACKDCTIVRIQEVVKFGVFFLLIILQINSKKRLEVFFWVFVLLNAKIAFEVMVGFVTGAGAVMNQGLTRANSASSVTDNFNGIAITINTVFPFVYYMFFHYKKLWIRIFLGGLLILFATTVISTGSRGGLLGFLAILGFIWWQSRNKALFAAMAVVIMIGGWFSISEERRARYITITDTENIDESSQGRIDAWIDGMQLFISQPITGVGAGGVLQARVERFGVWLDPHNLYVQVLAELGLIGGFTYFGFILWIFRINRRLIRESGDDDAPHKLFIPFARATIIACAAMLVTGMFAHSMYRYSWYLLAALTVAGERILASAKAAVAAAKEESTAALAE